MIPDPTVPRVRTALCNRGASNRQRLDQHAKSQVAAMRHKTAAITQTKETFSILTAIIFCVYRGSWLSPKASNTSL